MDADASPTQPPVDSTPIRRQWDPRLVGLVQRADGPIGPRVAAVALVLVAVVALWLAGRAQWFARDDWAFLLTRRAMGETVGWDHMLLAPQDGHWMTGPILVFWLLHRAFGLGSYWPYLLTLWLTHVAVVAMVWAWMRRFGVSAWTTVLVSAVVFAFGAGWENMLFAVQITYNLSLIAFLAQLWLVDHEGGIDRRDIAAAVLGLVSVTSSGFGGFFIVGVAILLLLRRRWLAAVVVVVPQSIALAWWWSTWGADPAGDTTGTASARFVFQFTRAGMDSTFGSLLGDPLLAGAGVALCVAVVVWSGFGSNVRIPAFALVATAVIMYAGVGARREVFGLGAAQWSRYQYMAAMLLVPVLAVALDQARRFSSWAPWVVRALLLFAFARNLVWLDNGSDVWAAGSRADREVFALVAGSPERDLVDPNSSMTLRSADVRVRDLTELVESGAITPRTPTTDEERQLVAQALSIGVP